jgi:lipid-A-disaccharide synthase
MFIAGDPSGDEHASHIVARLKSVLPDIECAGIGGARMQSHGFTPIMPFAPFNRMGVGEVLANIGFFIGAKRCLAEYMKTHKPALVVLVDYAGFNMQILKIAYKLHIPTLWYIGPKVWAWKKKRASVIGKYADEIAVILPFEPSWFEGYGARVSYVGNPCVEQQAREQRDAEVQLRSHRPHTDAQPWRIAVVPGSRPQEIARIFPSMAKAAGIVRKRYPVEFKVSVYHGLDRELFMPFLLQEELQAHTGNLNELLAWADIGMVTSGTATLQAALMGVPHVLVYRMSLINELAFNTIVRIKYIGLPNIIAGRQIIKECIQKQAAAVALSNEITRFIEDSEYYNSTCRELEALRRILGDKKPSEEVSRLIQQHVS